MTKTTRNRISGRVVLLAVLATAAFGQTEVPKVPFEKHTLPNGLQLILHVDRKLPTVNVNLWYHVGSKNERAGRSGFAHLFEHMMFEGSKNAPGKTLQIFEKLGANLFEGGVNRPRKSALRRKLVVRAHACCHSVGGYVEDARMTSGPAVGAAREDSTTAESNTGSIAFATAGFQGLDSGSPSIYG